MKSLHIAVCTQMGNGHLYPALPLCSELAKRGHCVSVATHERYANLLRVSGAHPVVFRDYPVSPALRAENEARSQLPPGDPRRLATSDLEWDFLEGSTRDFLAQVTGFYASNVPDVVLYNRYCLAGRLLSHRLHTPAVQFSPHFAYPGRTRIWERGVAILPPEMDAYAARVDELFASYGIRTAGNLWHLEKLNIHLIPPEFQYHREIFDDRFFFAGSLLGRPWQHSWRRRQTSAPLVLVSGYSGLPETRGSQQGWFETFVSALADTDCHCVLSIGDRVDPETLAPLPANFEVNTCASHLEILPHAALFICHGGMGRCLEALYHGVPVLTIPASPYTEEVALRVTELRVGTLLSASELTPARVRRIVAEMLGDECLRERARSTQRRFDDSPGAAATALRIERFLCEEDASDLPQITMDQSTCLL